MVRSFRVAPLWLWFMVMGLGVEEQGSPIFWSVGQRHSLVVVALFMVYAAVFLLRYGLRPYLEVHEEELRWAVPPFFRTRRLPTDRVIELYGTGDHALLLVTRSGQEVKIPFGFLRPSQRHEAREAVAGVLADLVSASTKK